MGRGNGLSEKKREKKEEENNRKINELKRATFCISMYHLKSLSRHQIDTLSSHLPHFRPLGGTVVPVRVLHTHTPNCRVEHAGVVCPFHCQPPTLFCPILIQLNHDEDRQGLLVTWATSYLQWQMAFLLFSIIS